VAGCAFRCQTLAGLACPACAFGLWLLRLLSKSVRAACECEREREREREREERGSRLALRSCCCSCFSVSFSHSSFSPLFLLICKTPSQPSALILSTDWKVSRRHPSPPAKPFSGPSSPNLRSQSQTWTTCTTTSRLPRHPHFLTPEFLWFFQKSEFARGCVHRTSAQPLWTRLSLCHPSRPVNDHLYDLERTLKPHKTHPITIWHHHWVDDPSLPAKLGFGVDRLSSQSICA
jgi:hypothetical protein